MCGKPDPRFIYAWPSAKIAVMEANRPLKHYYKSSGISEKRKEKKSPRKEKGLLEKMISRYNHQTTATYAAARLWVDAIIDPKETRIIISENIAAANHNPDIPEFKTGVIQV